VPPKKSFANQALGKAIRAVRAERSWSQEGFAQRASLDRANYSAIECGEFNVTVDTLVRLAAGLGTSVCRRAKL
jgi:transcriptional regulator with XRE-family HTH domain